MYVHVKFISDSVYGRTAPADLEPAPQRVRVRVWVTSGVGLVWADVQG